MPTKTKLVENTMFLLRSRGKAALSIAEQTVLQEKIAYKPIQEALTYFIKEVFQDVMQPGLLSLYCEAVGGNPEETVPVGAAMVLLVGAADIHDDIIDHSKVKNKKPTVLGKFGPEITILAGDALLIEGTLLLNEATQKLPENKRIQVSKLIKQAFFNLSSAEAEETNQRGKMDLSGQQYLEIIRKKMAVSEATAKIGAILGNGSNDLVEVMGNIGFSLGLLNTLRDEFIDVFEPKELENRATKEILPLPILTAFQNTKNKEIITQILSSGKMTKEKATTIVDIVMDAEETTELKKAMQTEIQSINSQLLRLKHCRKTIRLLAESSLEDLF